MKKKILILGSSGQIGSHLEEFLKKKKKYEVLKFDILLGKSFDLRNFRNKNIEKYIKKSDFVYFLAFDVGGSRYLNKYQKTYNFMINNLLIMGNVFKLLKKLKKKFVFASSQMSNMDFSTYGTLKRLGEDITKSLNCLYVKFWNVYGIEKDFQKAHVVTDFVLMALKKKKIKMLTSGMEKREFLYADDCSEGLFEMMQKFNFFAKKGVELHLTTAKKTRIIDIAKIIKNILKHKEMSVKILPSRKKDNLQKSVNNLSNNFFLKFWKPKHTVKSGIEKIIEYHLKKDN